MEFIVNGPPEGVNGLLVTRTVDTGPGGENDPNRCWRRLSLQRDAPEPRSKLRSFTATSPATERAMAGNVPPVRTRSCISLKNWLIPMIRPARLSFT